MVSSCGQHQLPQLKATLSTEQPDTSTQSENKANPIRNKKLLLSGGVIVGGVATCLLVIKTKKICRGLFRKNKTAEHSVAEALAEIKKLEEELEHVNASHGRLYEKHLNLQKETSSYLGRQANINGDMFEYVSTKEIPLILHKQGIKVKETIQNVKGQYKNSDKKIVHFEIDAIFLTEDSAYFLEAKTQLHRSHVDKLANHIDNFDKARFDHQQISEKINAKQMKGIITYIFDSKMPRDLSEHGKSASDYAQGAHDTAAIRILNWKEFNNKDLANLAESSVTQ